MLVRLQYNLNVFNRFGEKSSNIIFNEYPSSGSRVVPSKQNDGRTQTDMTATIAFRNFANAPKNSVSEILTISNNRHRQPPSLKTRQLAACLISQGFIPLFTKSLYDFLNYKKHKFYSSGPSSPLCS